MHVIEIYDLVGISFLMSEPEDNQRLPLKIGKALDIHQDNLNDDPSLKEMLLSLLKETLP